MQSEFPNAPMPSYLEEEMREPFSRLQDERIFDESGAEAKANSALAPAGLKNPFWK